MFLIHSAPLESIMSDSPNRRPGAVLSLRVTRGDVEALDQLRHELRPLGLDLSRHAAARAALRRGLDAMKQDATDPGGAS